MDDYQRIHIDNLVHEATDLLCETSIARCGGPTRALEALRSNADGDGIWLDRFVSMFLGEHALDGVSGAAVIVEAFEKRPASQAWSVAEAKTVGAQLTAVARELFGDRVKAKCDEALEQAAALEGGVS